MDNSEKQMEMLLEEGGIADDGMNVDPVSGNDVPPGSMASEVRDDIPAQLSEGEYVVPADVLRFYGVKFFEDLRSQAKMGLADMEQNGRIGGEPMPSEGAQMDGGDLTPEEMAVLQEMGMAVGGFVPQATQSTQPDPYMQQQAMYRQNAPVAMGNTGYNEGGLEDGETADYLQPTFDPSMFQAGFTFLDEPTTTEPVTRTVTMYGPNGEVETLTLPAQQARYDELLAMGYSETQVATTTETTVGEEVQQESDSGGFDTSQPMPEPVPISEMNDDQLASNAKGIGLVDALSKALLGSTAAKILATATSARYNDILNEMNNRGLNTDGMERRGSVFGGEGSLYEGLADTDGKQGATFGDTWLGDLLGFDEGGAGVQGAGLKESFGGARRTGGSGDNNSTGNVSTGSVSRGNVSTNSGSRTTRSSTTSSGQISDGPSGKSSNSNSASSSRGVDPSGDAGDSGYSPFAEGGIVQRPKKKKKK